MDYLRLGAAIRDARKAKNLTQVQLKSRLDCSQSQISELEQGIHNAVSRELLERIAAELEVDLRDFARQDSAALVEESRYAFCSSQTCPAARPFVFNGRSLMKPHFVPLGSGAKKCEFCGDVLAFECQQEGCRHPVHPGFFCRHCGEPYIEVPNGLKNPASAEAKARQVDEFLRQFEAS